jgi:hypothetical protein
MLRSCVAIAVLVAGAPAEAWRKPDRNIIELEAELEAAWAELRANKPDAIEHLTKLRARAEQLTRRTATVGLDVDSVATIAGSKLRVLGGDGFALVVDRANEPVAWFSVAAHGGPCPPCSPNARTVVVRATSPRLVEIFALETGPGFVLDLTTLEVRAHAAGNGQTAPSPDGKRLALVDLSYDEEGECSAMLSMVAASGHTTTASGDLIPHDMCQGNYAVAWRGSRIVVTSDWSEDHATIAIKSGAATTMHGKAPVIREGPHQSKGLSARQKAAFAKVGCTVGERFVFPPAVCADLTEPEPTSKTSPQEP